MNAQAMTQYLKCTGWSDAAIARHCGCSQPTITRIRNGQVDPRESIVQALANLVTESRQLITPRSPESQSLNEDAIHH